MAQAATVLAERLAELRPAQAQTFRANAAAFTAAVEDRMPEWQARVADAPGVVLFHDDGRYVAERFGVAVLGTIEPLPGIPPTASHLIALVRELAGRDGVVIRAAWHPAQGPNFVARELGWPVRQVRQDVPLDRLDRDAWFAMIDAWIDALVGGAER
jgi:zinc/manganese transport system substrate-binding protein